MRIAVLDDYQGVALEMADWGSLGEEITVFRETVTDHAKLVAQLSPFGIVCLMRERTPFPARLMEALPNLRLIVTTGPRNLAIDLEAARKRGITVCGTGSRKTSTSELAMTMILALSRRILPEALSMRDGGWQVGLGRDLAGLTLGLVGLGTIGAQMSRLGQAFGMEVAAWSQNLTEARCAELGVRRMESLTALMAASDAVSVHLVLSDRTRGLIGREAFAAMREGAIFVNTSRAPIADTQALVEGLRAGRPAMVGLDVYDVEPLPADDPLRDRALIDEGRLLLTPHIGYVTEATWRVFYTETVEAIAAWKAGAPVRVLA